MTVRSTGTAVGGLLALLGGVWFLQGIGVLPGSFMTGSSSWAVAGAAALLVGVALLYAVWHPRG